MDLEGYDVRVADSSWKRFKGLMFQSLDDDEIMLFKFRHHTDKNFHTFFMRQPIDMIFLDQDHEVVQLEESVSPWSIVTVDSLYQYVIEAIPGFVKNNGLEVGLCVDFH